MLGVIAAAVVVAAWVTWFRLLNQVRIPRNRIGFLVANGIGALLGIVALAAGVGILDGILAGVAILGGATFLALAAASAQAKVTPAVSVGSPILEFTAPDEHGRPFDLASLRGKPFLLKFFRGHW